MSTEVGKLYVQFDADGRPYIQGLQQIDARTKAFQRDQQTAFGKLGNKLGSAIKLGMAAGAAAVAAGGTLITKSLIKTAASYEYEMSRIKAVTNATTAEMKALDAIALKLGKDTVFSANEAAQGINELAKAGVSVADILGGGISGTLALAAAGELEVAAAAEVASNAMNIFGLTGKDVGMVADTLAAAANASSLEVSDLAYSLKYAGPVAQSLGIPFQQLAAILAELGNQGIRGEQAGAGLASMLQALTAPTDAATRQLEQYGIAIYDAESNMRSMPDILGDMNAALNDLDDESRMTFVQAVFGKGSDSAIALKLIEGGSEALEEMTKTVSKQGEAARVSAQKMDNFRGSMEELRGSVETLTIKLGTPLINALRPFVDKLSEGVDWAADFYDGLQNLSGWEGADLGGKIRIAWDELTRQFEEWFAEGGESTLADMSEAIGKGLVDVASTVGTTAAQFLLGVIGLDDSTWGKAGRTIAAGFLTGIAEGIVEQIWDAAMYLARGRLDAQGILPEEAGVMTFAVEYHVSERTAIDLLETMGKISEEAAKHMRDKLDAGLKLGEPGKKNAEESGKTGGKLFVDEFGNVLPEIIPYYNSAMNKIDAAGTGRSDGQQYKTGFVNALSDINTLIQEKFDMRRSAYSAGQSAAQGVGPQGGFGGSGSGAAIFDFANNYLGTPYVFGGQSPGGFDCSGLMWYAYQHFGIDIPRLSQDQFAYGRPVSNPRVGDLVFFRSSGTNSAPGHVGMYAGNGMFLEAPYTGASVRYSYLANRSDYVGARAYTYHDGGLIGSQGGGGEVLIHAQAGERVLSQEQSRLFETFVREIGQIADEIREGNEEEEAFNEAFLARLSERLDALAGYTSRESARLAMQRAEFAPGGFDASEMAAMVHTLTTEIEHLDMAVAEAEAQLNEAKWMKLPQAEINRLAENLFGLRTEAADARRELEELERVPLEQALDHWANAADNLSRIMDVLSDHSNSFALMGAQFPGLMGSLGGSYQTNLDLMRGATLPSDIMGYGSAALSDLSSMYGAEQAQLQRALDKALDSIDGSQDDYEKSWQARADALDDQIEREQELFDEQMEQQEEALSAQLEDLSDAHQDELDALNKFYDDKLRTLEDREREITRAEQRNRAAKSVAGLEDELRILRGQGYYTEADIARMRELETQIQEQRDEMTRQEAAWAREDERTRLRRERDEAVASLEQQQEMARIALEDQVEAARKSLEAQQDAQRKSWESRREALEEERRLQQEHFDQLREQAQAAYQAELDKVIEKYAALMQEVIDAQNEMLGEAGTYQNAGQTLGLAFAQGIMDAIPAIQAAAQAAAEAAAQYLELNSPADKGPLSTLDRWWEKFVPTLVRPLDTYQAGQAASAVAAGVRQVARAEEVIRIEFAGDATGLDIRTLADIVEDRLKRKIDVRRGGLGRQL